MTPRSSNKMELGADGMLTGAPAAKGAAADGLVMGTMVGVQAVVAVLHPVEVAKAAGLAGFDVPRTVKLIADSG